MPPVALIQEIGAYAGLLALPALVVLAVLHFSQARDVRRLREWAGRAPERAAAQRAAAPRAMAGAQAVPPQAGPPEAGPAEAPATAPASPAPPATAARPAPSTPAASARTAVAEPPQPRVDPPAHEQRPAWARDEHFGLRGAPRSGLAAHLERVPLRVAGIALAGLAVVLVIIVVVSSGGSSGAPQRPASPTAAKPASVAILNATTVAGLGHQVGARVKQAGYRLGAVGDASPRPGQPSVVMYAAGDAQQAALVARSIGVARTGQADSATEAQARGAAVIVVVGADLAQGAR